MGAVMASRTMLYRGLLGLLAAVAVAGCTAGPASGPAPPGHGRSASPTALTAVSPGPASGSASAGPGGVRALAVSRDVRNELTAAFADYKGIPPSDVAGISPGSVYYAFDPATGTYWAEANFLPSLTAPAKVLVGFQDGASIGLFTRFANGSWQVQLGGEPAVCTEVAFFPRAVLTAWSLPADTAGFECTAPPARAVFAASFAFMSATPGRGDGGERIALLSSQTGHLVRWLTQRQDGTYDAVLSVHDGWVYFLRNQGRAPVATWRVPITGGPAQLATAGYTLSAVSPDGHVVASEISADHGYLVELVARNLVTGRHNTIIVATSPDQRGQGISSLSWAPDDTHLAVQFSQTPAINSVLVLDAFTAATVLGDGRIAPAPCPAAQASWQCTETDPAYLASGALTYVIQQISSTGAASASLVWWLAGYRSILLSFPGVASQLYPVTLLGLYDMTAQGQAIWVSGPAQPKGPWTIWRWSGGAPVKITTLPPLGISPYYGVLGIAW
jgi:hypothetical protein